MLVLGVFKNHHDILLGLAPVGNCFFRKETGSRNIVKLIDFQELLGPRIVGSDVFFCFFVFVAGPKLFMFFFFFLNQSKQNMYIFLYKSFILLFFLSFLYGTILTHRNARSPSRMNAEGRNTPSSWSWN